MKRIVFLSVLALSFALLGCEEGNSSSGNSSYNPSFKGAGVVRTVTLYSEYGGVINGYGTFYEGRKEVVWEGLTIGVKSSDKNRWNYMIVWNDGSKWYFD